MAGIAFTAGQTMVRPGVYNRYVQVSTPLYEGASDGIVACVLLSLIHILYPIIDSI